MLEFEVVDYTVKDDIDTYAGILIIVDGEKRLFDKDMNEIDGNSVLTFKDSPENIDLKVLLESRQKILDFNNSMRNE